MTLLGFDTPALAVIAIATLVAFVVRGLSGFGSSMIGADTPEALVADEPLAVALRAGSSVASREAVHSALPGELAIVLSRQRDLDAFMLVGPQRDGRALRSDEVVAMRNVLQTAGLEWQALRWAALQRQVEHSPRSAS